MNETVIKILQDEMNNIYIPLRKEMLDYFAKAETNKNADGTYVITDEDKLKLDSFNERISKILEILKGLHELV